MTKFKNKYRIKSNRLQGWDYSKNGYYFITLVTQNRDCNLGKIVHGKMVLSDFGKIVYNEWLKSFEIRNELDCDQFIIMPNHLHAIVVLNNPENKNHDIVPTDDSNDLNVETHGRASLHGGGRGYLQQRKQPFYRKPKSISSFIAGFKSAVNSKINNYIDENNLNIPKYNRNNHFFQPNYYDHIIRNEPEYHRIVQYIIDNPINWENDKLNGGNGNIVMEQLSEYNIENWMV